MTDHHAHDPLFDGEGLALSFDAVVELESLSDEEFELVSAYLDGEVDDAERDSVERDPRLMLHVKHLGAIAGAVSLDQPSPLLTALDASRPHDDPSRETHLAAALAAWEGDQPARHAAVGEPESAQDTTPVGETLTGRPRVVAIGERRPHRARTHALARRVLAIAAALVVVAGVGGIVVRLGQLGTSSTESATAGGADEVSSQLESSKAALSAASETDAGGGATAPVGDLGTFDDIDTVVSVARSTRQAQAATSGEGTTAEAGTTADAAATTNVAIQPTSAGVSSTTAASTTAASTTAASTTAASTTAPAAGATAPAAGATDTPVRPGEVPSCGPSFVPFATARVGDRPVLLVLGPNTIDVIDATSCTVIASRPLVP